MNVLVGSESSLRLLKSLFQHWLSVLVLFLVQFQLRNNIDNNHGEIRLSIGKRPFSPDNQFGQVMIIKFQWIILAKVKLYSTWLKRTDSADSKTLYRFRRFQIDFEKSTFTYFQGQNMRSLKYTIITWP